MTGFPARPEGGVQREGRPIDIRELRTFVTVVRGGSVSRAAEELNVAQPALSRQLKKLEEELGVTLLDRHGRGVTVTRAGSLLLARAEALLAEFAGIGPAVRASDDVVAGHVTLGVPPAAGLLIAPAVFRSFRARWPAATLQIREGISSLLEEWLLDGRLDVAVLHNPPPLDGIALQPILQERMVLVRARGAVETGPVRFRDLAAVPLILPSMPHSNRRLVERAALQHGVRLSASIEVDSIPLTKAMVAGGFGATILTHAGVARELASGELSAQPIDNPPLLSCVVIGSVAAESPRWLVGALAGLVAEEIASLVRSGAWAGGRLVAGEAAPA
ncbi:LysR family transcriptional regulator [Lichenibacterium minor]|uniref:LysR family transcriptional regulator n=1 Tax=Lichenibacterium minor TaxID=2316528 RepID=UPI001FE22F84|nr:LysR family transcriptional regulator [Lichenibacterium minor]